MLLKIQVFKSLTVLENEVDKIRDKTMCRCVRFFKTLADRPRSKFQLHPSAQWDSEQLLKLLRKPHLSYWSLGTVMPIYSSSSGIPRNKMDSELEIPSILAQPAVLPAANPGSNPETIATAKHTDGHTKGNSWWPPGLTSVQVRCYHWRRVSQAYKKKKKTGFQHLGGLELAIRDANLCTYG